MIIKFPKFAYFRREFVFVVVSDSYTKWDFCRAKLYIIYSAFVRTNKPNTYFVYFSVYGMQYFFGTNFKPNLWAFFSVKLSFWCCSFHFVSIPFWVKANDVQSIQHSDFLLFNPFSMCFFFLLWIKIMRQRVSVRETLRFT